MQRNRLFAFGCAFILLTSTSVLSAEPANTQPDALKKIEAVAGSLGTAIPKSLTPKQIEEIIVRAETSYKQGKFKDALTQLDRAQTEIRQQRVELFRHLLPAAPKDWALVTSPEEDGKSVGAALMGGGSTISRSFSSNGHTATVSYITDSPMVTMLSGLANALGGMVPAKTNQISVNGYNANYEEKSEQGKKKHMLTIFAGDVLVSVESETLDKETLVQFANLINLSKLTQVP